MRVQTPTQQYKAMADKIIARRAAKAVSNSKPAEDAKTIAKQKKVDVAKAKADKEAEEALAAQALADTEAEEAKVAKAKLEAAQAELEDEDEDEDPYQDLGRKQLRKLCDGRKPKLPYTSKTTKPQRNALLKG